LCVNLQMILLDTDSLCLRELGVWNAVGCLSGEPERGTLWALGIDDSFDSIFSIRFLLLLLVLVRREAFDLLLLPPPLP
jgi:hypothetical protein